LKALALNGKTIRKGSREAEGMRKIKDFKFASRMARQLVPEFSVSNSVAYVAAKTH